MSEETRRAALRLSREEMRGLGYRVVDRIVDHWEGLRERPIGKKATPEEIRARLAEELPLEGNDPVQVLDRVERDVLSHILHLDHPRFHAFIPSPSNFVSVLADALASGFNVFAGTWLEGSGPAEVERVTLEWLRQLIGLPETAGGTFVSGGSVANLTALAVARETKLRGAVTQGVVYGSDQTHATIDRALRVLGLGGDGGLRRVRSDARFRIDPSDLEEAIRSDRAAGKTPFAVVANAGTTNTGAVDPLGQLVRLCRREGLWLHADAAYGGAAALVPGTHPELSHLANVDSLALDPHKWLFQPYEIGCVLLRERGLLRETFHVFPEYLQDLSPKEGEVNFSEWGIQLSRGFRALKLWMSIQVFGWERFRGAIRHGIRLAEHAERLLRGSAAWEVVTPAELAIVTFRYAPEGLPEEKVDALQHRMVAESVDEGFALVSSTILGGKSALRMCAIHPAATEEDVAQTLRFLEGIGARHARGTD